MDKPTKPTNLMPRSFGGLKENFSESLQETGVEPNVPVIYHGANFNYEKDTIGKELDYCEKIVDFINGLPIGKTITTDSNNKLQYADLAQDVPIATTETAGIVKPDGTTITVQADGTISSVVGDDFADKDINNLNDFGNARLQYAPFAINAGTVINGNNHTLQSGSLIQSYTEAGSYTIEITEAGNYEIEMYGAGGGWAHTQWNTDAWYSVTSSGGSGSGYKGVLNLPIGIYTVTVGSGGTGGSGGDRGSYTGGTGGATTFGNIISAGGGTGGSTAFNYGARGVGGTVNIIDSSVIVSTTFNRSGNDGSEESKFYSGDIATVKGGVSVYDDTHTGYGAGGGYKSPSVGGYFKITKLTGDASKIFCDPCTLTTCDGRTKIFDTATSIDVTNQSDGSYSIFKDYETGELSLVDGLTIAKTENVIYYPTSIIPKMTSATTPEGTVTTTGSNWYNGGWAGWGDDPDNPTANVGQPVGASGTSSNTYTFESAVLGRGKFSFYQGGNSTGSYCANYSLTAIFEDDTEDTFYTATDLIYPAGANTGLRDNVELNYNKKIKAFRCTVTMAGSNYQAGTGYTAFRYYEAIDAYWLDTSTIPANLKVNGVINNDLVYIGDCTILSGGVTALENRYFNDSGYLNEKSVLNAIMPDYNAGVAKANNTDYVADIDGFLVATTDDYSGGQSVLYVNNEVYNITSTNSGTGQLDASTTTMLIPKGTSYKVVFARISSTTKCIFYPLKGAN